MERHDLTMPAHDERGADEHERRARAAARLALQLLGILRAPIDAISARDSELGLRLRAAVITAAIATGGIGSHRGRARTTRVTEARAGCARTIASLEEAIRRGHLDREAVSGSIAISGTGSRVPTTRNLKAIRRDRDEIWGQDPTLQRLEITGLFGATATGFP